MPRSPSDYVFFWKIDQEHGWASQWYRSKFKGPSTFEGLQTFVATEKQKLTGSTTVPSEPSTSITSEPQTEQEDWIPFMTAEHFMMFHKAMLFAHTHSTDHKIKSTNEAVAHRLLTTTNPKIVKDMGRQVKGFSDGVWHRHRDDIVLAGNILKFRQNPGLGTKLLETGQKKIVEASPMDKIWGIGLDAKRASESLKSDGEKRWGLNLLGLALEQTRSILVMETQKVVQESEQSEPGPSTVPQAD
ncbi:2567_t:CDS:2 [Acaulospora colombiana]|uniref:2567_t:CDS:1 n=1 Tax=Acaulospora colombiana TaxID=27376 RepID=A0ACA9LBN8_9GLOM|nr:2567_t:CDS:2 [Acaulospora colombiana]